MDSSTDEIRFSRLGRAGVATLTRPEALNALTHGMVTALAAQLKAWRDDPAIAHVVIEGTGDKAFSAGGDIRQIYEMGKAGDPKQIQFFRDEYPLNHLIKTYPKPYTALIDGIVMGGGVGVSVNGRFRAGTEKLAFAMPEVGIGFFPDVGGTFFLPRCPGELGMYLALSGARLGQADALHAGIITHAVGRDRLDALKAALGEAEDPEPVLAAFSVTPAERRLAPFEAVIDRAFGCDSVAAILATLDKVAGGSGAEAEFAGRTAREIRLKSPTSLRIAFVQVRRGRGFTFAAAMRTEYRIVSKLLAGADFYEGVRAVIIDKDNRPNWRPARLEEVDPVDIEAHFMAPEGGDLSIGD